MPWIRRGLCPQVLQTGRFSMVWRGSLRGVPVVIKAFPAASDQHFAAEWGVLSRPLMNHDNLVQLLEARRGDGPSRRGGLLVMPLYAQVSRSLKAGIWVVWGVGAGGQLLGPRVGGLGLSHPSIVQMRAQYRGLGARLGLQGRDAGVSRCGGPGCIAGGWRPLGTWEPGHLAWRGQGLMARAGGLKPGHLGSHPI